MPGFQQHKPTFIILAVATLMALLLAIIPAIIGQNVREVAITNAINMLPPEMRSQLEIRETSFNRGWLRTEAQLQLSYLPLGSEELDIRLDMDIQHGPILFTPRGMSLGLIYARILPAFDNAEIREFLLELPFPVPPATLDLQVGFGGTVRAGINIAPVQHADGNGELAFEGITALFIANTDQSAEFELTMGRLSAHEFGSSMQVTIDSLSVQSRTAQISDLLAPASVNIDLPAFRSEAPYPIEVTDLTLESRIQPSLAGPERTDIYQRFTIAQIQSEFPVTSFSWTSEINETRSDLFRRYYELLVQIQTEMDNNGGNVSAQVTQAAEELSLLILQNRIVFNNSLNTNAYGGDHSADLRLLWRGLPNSRGFATLDLNAAIAALELTLDMALDLEAIMRSPLAELVDPYVQQGYLQLENGRIVVRLSVQDSVLIMNGERLELEQFL